MEDSRHNLRVFDDLELGVWHFVSAAGSHAGVEEPYQRIEPRLLRTHDKSA
jgi:hypothetical protein